MGSRDFEITLLSANNLEDVRNLFNTKAYVRVSVGSSTVTDNRTPADTHGELNPAWNFTMRYTIPESAVQYNNTILVIKLYCKRTLGDRYIGEVHTPLKELFDHANRSEGSATVTHPVKKGSVNSQGVLTFSYRFGPLAQNIAD